MIQVAKVASFTRPADTTAYTQKDVISNSTSAGAALQFLGPVPGTKCKLMRVQLQSSSSTATATETTLHLFSSDPGTQNDNGAQTAVAYAAANPLNYLGAVDLAARAAVAGHSGSISDNVSSTAGAELLSIVHPNAQAGTIYGILTARNATPFTPASAEAFVVTIWLAPEEAL